MKYHGLYYGTVIRNSDIVYGDTGELTIPAGRVLVKLDGLSFTDKQGEEYNFPFGNNISGSVNSKNLELLEQYEILCDVAHSVIGNDGAGVYSAKTGDSTISESSDTSIWSEAQEHGSAPARMFQSEVSDGYGGEVGNIGTASVNTNALAYASDYRSNQARGSFSLPGVGARVLVQFINGSYTQPVITHVIQSEVSFANMFDAGGNVYPGIPNAADVYSYNNQIETIQD
jgi:hypothetical protein